MRQQHASMSGKAWSKSSVLARWSEKRDTGVPTHSLQICPSHCDDSKKQVLSTCRCDQNFWGMRSRVWRCLKFAMFVSLISLGRMAFHFPSTAWIINFWSTTVNPFYHPLGLAANFRISHFYPGIDHDCDPHLGKSLEKGHWPSGAILHRQTAPGTIDVDWCDHFCA